MGQDFLLEKALGKSSVLKILDVFMTHPSADYSKKDIAEVTGLAESTVHRNWDNIEELDVLKKSRKYGNTQLYKIDQDSEIVKQLYKLDQKLREEKETDLVEA